MIKQATHRHRLNRMANLVYRVKGKHVFMQVNGEWIKSSVESHELVRIKRFAPGEDVEESQVVESKVPSKPLIAKHKRTKAELGFNDVSEAVEAGFDKYLIEACISGKKYTHQGYVWRKAA